MEINLNDITKAMQETLVDYTVDVVDKMEKSADRNAKKGAKTLREIDIRRTGRYASGWTKKKDGTAHVIRNKDRYQLSHLIENGYTLRNGKRKKGRPHIKPVEKQVIKDYMDDVRKAIGK